MFDFGLVIFFIQATMCEDDNRIITTLKYSTYRVKPTIVNGKPVLNERVPYLVSFKEPCSRISLDSLLWCNLCGGSIISEQRVLTAAHCFEGRDYYYMYNPHHLKVVAGTNQTSIVHSGKPETTSDLQIRNATRVIMHRDFHFPNNDIALVFTEPKWVYSEHVYFISPAMRTRDYADSCVSAGYGKTAHYPGAPESPTLLMAAISTLSRWRCSTLWQMNMDRFVCSDAVFGDVGRGDSGGPLACFDAKEEFLGKELLVGVVSGKNFDKTTLFTRVSSYRHWIETDSASGAGQDVLVRVAIIAVLLIYLLFAFTV